MITSKNKIIITSLIAPAFVAYLAYKPYGGFPLYTSIGTCFLIVVVSTISIIIKTVKAIFSKIKKERYPLIRLLRPTIAVISALSGLLYLQSIENKAKEYLWQTAIKVQAICEAQNKCPDDIEGWKKKTDQYWQTTVTYYVNQTQFHMFYCTYNNSQDFDIFINYGIDSRYRLIGGVHRKVGRPNGSAKL